MYSFYTWRYLYILLPIFIQYTVCDVDFTYPGLCPYPGLFPFPGILRFPGLLPYPVI